MIAGITVLPARLTRVAPAGTATPCPAWTILLPSMTSVPFSTTLPLPTMSRAPSNAVTSARAGPVKQANGNGGCRRDCIHSAHETLPAVKMIAYAACLAICCFSRE